MSDNRNPPLAGAPCPPALYGIGAFFVAPVAAIFCILMGAMMILAWPFIPFLCYMQRKEEIRKANALASATAEERLVRLVSNHQYANRHHS